MSIVGSSPRGGHGWQLILADLALILFLLTLSALPAAEATSGERLADGEAREKDAQGPLPPEIAPAQALYRPLPGGPSLSQWLAAQAPDPRATLTIIAAHKPGGEAAAWAKAEALAKEARTAGARVRTIITTGPDEEIHASLAYDALLADGEGAGRRS
jgi:hypothetical protein